MLDRSPESNRNDSIRVGLLAPLTGIVELYGPEIVWAARIACEQVNENGGVLGRPLEIVVADDGSLPDSAVPAAHRLLDDDGCVALIGNLLSNSRIAVSDLVSDARKVPLLNFSFYEGSITSPYFFHFAALPNQQVAKMIPYMTEHVGPKMFFAGSNYEWPRGSIDYGMRTLDSVGGETVGEEYLPIGTQEVDELLEKVLKSGADVFVPYFAGADQVNVLTRFTEMGLKDRVAVVMGHYDEAMAGRLSPEVRGGFYSSNTYFMGIETRENEEYLRRLKSRQDVDGVWPHGNGVLTNFGEGVYHCVKAFAEAANRSGSVDAADLVESLETVKTSGPQGVVTMNRDTHHATVNTFLSRCNVDGTFTILESFGQIHPVIPERYRSEFHRPAPIPVSGKAAVKKIAGRFPVAEPQAGACVTDVDGSILYVNSGFKEIWGSDESMVEAGRQVADLWMNPDEIRKVLKAPFGTEAWTGQLLARIGSGKQRLLDVAIAEMLDNYHQRIGFTFSCVDLSVPEGVDDFTIESPSDKILSVADIAIIAVVANGEIVQVNTSAVELFGYSREEMVGMSVHLLLPPRFRDAHETHLSRFAVSAAGSISMAERGELSGYKKDGSEFPLEASVAKVRSGDAELMVVTLRDITERKSVEEALTWQATHDPLTGLPNRTLIGDRLQNALARSGRDGSKVALLFVDVDGFKLVNDSYGHEQGDEVLKEVADRLVGMVRPGYTVARFGGDEFLILTERVNSEAQVGAFADRLIDGIKAPLEIGTGEVSVTVSVGIAMGNGNTHTATDMLRMADGAMYLAKQTGRDGWKIFDETIRERARRELVIASGLRSVVQNGELRIVAQPLVKAGSELPVGVEVLLRWDSPQGPISPELFIPIAERNGNIVPIGRWVFEKACELKAQWQKEFGVTGSPFISINVSARQLAVPGTVEEFKSILKRTGADPKGLVLEVTETALMTDVEENVQVLKNLAALGMKLAIDDFGTGYSSLGQMVSMPLHSLKIDKMFVQGLRSVKDTTEVVTAIIRMAHSLGLEVTAEGVETQEQLWILQSLGCDRAQGYLMYEPMELKAATKLFRSLRNKKGGSVAKNIYAESPTP